MRLAALLILTSLSVQAEVAEWQERLAREGITVSVRQVPGSKYEEFLAVVDLQTSAASAVALLQDNSACAKWVHRCVSSEVIETVSTTERYFHQVTALPFPARSRDAVFHGAIHFDNDRGITVTLASAQDRLPVKKHVRITETYGHYHIESISADAIRLTWQFYVDPAGSLPAFMVNSMVTDLPFESLSAFRELVTEPPYDRANFVYDASGAPIDINFITPTQPGVN